MVELARRVLENSSYNLISVFISKFGGLIFTIILARLLAPDLFGLYHLALSVAFLLLAFTDFGINSTLIRYLSYSIGKTDEIIARSYLWYLSKLKLLATILCSLGIIILSDTLASAVFHKPFLSGPLMIMGVFLFFMSLLEFVTSIFVSLLDFKYIIWRHVVYELSKLGAVTILILLGYQVYGALWGTVLSTALALFVLVLFLIRKYPSLIRGAKVGIDKKIILRFLSYLSLASITGIVFVYVDSIMIGILLPIEEVGFYRASYNVIFAIIGFVSIISVLFPVFSQLEGKELEGAFQKVFRYTSLFVFPISLGLLFLVTPLIEIIYGVDYLPAALPTYVLSLLIIIIPLDFFGALLNSKEKPEYPAKLMMISALLNVILNYYFIIYFGMVGAATATVISRYFHTISLGIIAIKILKIQLDFSAIYKPLFSSLVMLSFLYIAPKEPLVLLIGVVFISAVIYFGIMYIIKGISKEDIIYLNNIVKGEKI